MKMAMSLKPLFEESHCGEKDKRWNGRACPSFRPMSPEHYPFCQLMKEIGDAPKEEKPKTGEKRNWGGLVYRKALAVQFMRARCEPYVMIERLLFKILRKFLGLKHDKTVNWSNYCRVVKGANADCNDNDLTFDDEIHELESNEFNDKNRNDEFEDKEIADEKKIYQELGQLDQFKDVQMHAWSLFESTIRAMPLTELSETGREIITNMSLRRETRLPVYFAYIKIACIRKAVKLSQKIKKGQKIIFVDDLTDRDNVHMNGVVLDCNDATHMNNKECPYCFHLLSDETIKKIHNGKLQCPHCNTMVMPKLAINAQKHPNSKDGGISDTTSDSEAESKIDLLDKMIRKLKDTNLNKKGQNRLIVIFGKLQNYSDEPEESDGEITFKAQLAEELDVSTKTINRDIELLKEWVKKWRLV